VLDKVGSSSNVIALRPGRRGVTVLKGPPPALAAPLLARVAAHDAAAARACIERYGGLVWSLVRRACPDPDEAEDAVQEIFVDVWKSAGRYDPAFGSEATFVATIARRRLIDRRRRERRRPHEPLSEALADPTAASQPELSAEAALASRAVAELRPEQRRVLLLSACEGLSHGEIARELSMPLGTVKAHVRRGLMHVKRALFGEGSGGGEGPGEESGR
jgi:RNA polymerase sigma-70 factor, ECF subfamily